MLIKNKKMSENDNTTDVAEEQDWPKITKV